MGLFRRLLRRRLARRELPAAWRELLSRRVPFFSQLPAALLEKFLSDLKIFAWEKHFFGTAGLAISDEIRVIISACAVRLILRLDLSYFDRLTEIVVYPHDYRSQNGEEIRLGEAHHWGTVVLSWPAVLAGLQNPCDGHDTALHEFAHVLDRATGHFDGTPRLRASEHYRAWAVVMSQHFLKLQALDRRELLVLRGYGAKNEAEFFAVATEAFFERPAFMQKLLPDLYQELKRLYGFDPAADPACLAPP